MATRYFIEAQTDCEGCDGQGIVYNYQWARYWREDPSGTTDPVTWFASAYGIGRSRMPPEEEECSACRGKGVVIEKVELAEALKRLGSLATA